MCVSCWWTSQTPAHSTVARAGSQDNHPEGVFRIRGLNCADATVVREDQQNTLKSHIWFYFALMNQEQTSYGNCCFHKLSRFDSTMSCEMWTADWWIQYCEKTFPLKLCFLSFSPVIIRIFRHNVFYVLTVLSTELSLHKCIWPFFSC